MTGNDMRFTDGVGTQFPEPFLLCSCAMDLKRRRVDVMKMQTCSFNSV